jgi:hypothetical protein
MVLLITASESCEKAGLALFIFLVAAFTILSLERFNSPWVANVT